MSPDDRLALIRDEAEVERSAEARARGETINASEHASKRGTLALLLAWRLDLTTAEALLALSAAPRGMDTGQAMTWAGRLISPDAASEGARRGH